jgi:hypothetical protein
MRVGQASVSDLIGILLYLLTWYLLFRLLTGMIPPSPGLRRFILLITALFALSGLLGLVGSALLGWPPLWILFYEHFYRPATSAELVIAPLALLAGLAVWGVLSLPGLPAQRVNRGLTLQRVLLVVAIGLLYEGGMVLFAWPPPWPWLLPSGPD